jgi:hypothetical protein
MAYVRRCAFDSTAGSFSETLTVGPYTFASLSKLFSVRASGTLIGENTNLTIPVVFVSQSNFGLQWGPTGYTPLDPVSQSSSPAWFWNYKLSDGDRDITWAPNSDTAVTTHFARLDQEWHGQLTISESIDMYLSIGNPFAFTAGFSAMTELEVLSAT